jgi:hypothetical protein
MGIRPLPRLVLCPNCGGCAQPAMSYLRNAWRAECACGVCGPYVKDEQWPHHAALEAWGRLFELRAVPAPPVAGKASS